MSNTSWEDFIPIDSGGAALPKPKLEASEGATNWDDFTPEEQAPTRSLTDYARNAVSIPPVGLA